MAINFPNAPTVGQNFVAPNGASFIWDGHKWASGPPSYSIYVPLAGGTMTGDLTINSPDGNNLILDAASGEWPGIEFNIPTGQGAWIGSYVGGNERWEIDLGNGVAEASGNVGSNFQIGRYANNGSWIDDPIVINRASGLVSFSQHAPVNDSSYNAADTYWVMNQLAGRSNRNRIMNGDFRVDQRNNFTSITPASGAYVADRWMFGATQTGKITTACITAGSGWGVVLGSGLSITVAAAYAVVAADTFYIQQKIEWQNIMDCAFSRSVAQPLTLSFWAWATIAGTYSGCILNAAATRSYPFTFSLPVASTWYYITVTIPGDTGGTWSVANNAAGLLLRFDLGSGATYRGAAGAWSANNYVGATGAINLVGTAAAQILFANVQLEIGSQATPYEYKPISQVINDCQRYYQIGTVQDLDYSRSVGTYTLMIPYPVLMRATPTMTANFTTQSGATGAVNPQSAGFQFNRAVTAAINTTYNVFGTWTANSEM